MICFFFAPPLTCFIQARLCLVTSQQAKEVFIWRWLDLKLPSRNHLASTCVYTHILRIWRLIHRQILQNIYIYIYMYIYCAKWKQCFDVAYSMCYLFFEQSLSLPLALFIQCLHLILVNYSSFTGHKLRACDPSWTISDKWLFIVVRKCNKLLK